MTESTIGGQGGARRGAGRPRKGTVKSGDVLAYEQARAVHETAKAGRAQHALAVEQGEYLPREDVRQAGAVLMATLCQHLQSIVPNLERRVGVDLAVLTAVRAEIDAGLSAAAAAVRALHERR